MILIIGGAYQGKTEFAKKEFGVERGQIFACTEEKIDFSYPCIDNIELFSKRHDDPVAYFRAHRELWRESVLILEDISCGVVPMGVENRAWRLKNGQLAQYLAAQAERVSRIFCGLEQRLK